MSALDKTAMVLVIVGALNWGLIGALNVNVVDVVASALSGNNPDTREIINKVIYVLVGIAALWVAYKKLKKN